MNREDLGQEEKGPAQEVSEDLESLKGMLAQERAKAEGYLNNWQRAQADFLNLKRRSEQERAEVIKLANASLIAALLSILDDLERAFVSLPTNLEELTWVDGIRLIQRKLRALLEAQGLTEIKAVGEAFDPNLHEAVMRREGEEGKVLVEVQKGYKLWDRVIRPSLVVVGEGKPAEARESSQGG